MIDKFKGSKVDESGTYDQDWIKLVMEAKQSGLTISEIRSFLQKDESNTSMKSSLPKSNLQHI